MSQSHKNLNIDSNYRIKSVKLGVIQKISFPTDQLSE